MSDLERHNSSVLDKLPGVAVGGSVAAIGIVAVAGIIALVLCVLGIVGIVALVVVASSDRK